MKSEGLVNLVTLESGNQLETLPPSAKRGLMKALVLVGYTCDQEERDQYWDKVLKPLLAKFHAIIRRPDLKQCYNDEKIRSGLLSVIESFIGMVNF